MTGVVTALTVAGVVMAAVSVAGMKKMATRAFSRACRTNIKGLGDMACLICPNL